MAAITQTKDRWGIGSLVYHVDGFSDEADVSDIDSKPPVKEITAITTPLKLSSGENVITFCLKVFLSQIQGLCNVGRSNKLLTSL